MKASIHKQIFNLAVPAILSNITVPLLGMVDTALMGRQEDVALLGGLAIGSMFFNMIFWAFGFLRMGTTGPAAQAFGRNNFEETRNILHRALFLALTIGITLLIFQKPIVWLGLRLFSMEASVYSAALSYVSIRIWSAPASLSLFAYIGWFFGMQNARIPLLVTIIENVLNTTLSIYFVFVLDWGIAGVAWGSVLASYCSFFVASLFVPLFFKISLLPKSWKSTVEPVAFTKFLSINSDVFIRTLCLIFTYYFFTNVSAGMGETMLAANAILIQLWNLFSYGIDGFANAAESLVGKYVGKDDSKMIRKSIVWSLFWAMSVASFVSVLYFLFGEQILSIFTTHDVVITTALSVFIWTVFAPLTNAIAFILDGVFLGATRSSEMRNTMIISTFLVFLPVYFVTEPLFDVHSIWLAMTSYMIARGIGLGLWLPRVWSPQ